MWTKSFHVGLGVCMRLRNSSFAIARISILSLQDNVLITTRPNIVVIVILLPNKPMLQTLVCLFGWVFLLVCMSHHI